MDLREQLQFLAEAAAAPLSGSAAEPAVAAVPLFDADADPETQRRRAELAERMHAYGARDAVLWVPPGARLPEDADAAAALIAEAAAGLDAGAVGEVAFPVKIGLRKTGADGSYMSVLGGLSQQWARFTNQVIGQFQLDSSAIHRLPRDPDAVTQLVDFLVLAANGLRAEGAETVLDAEDTWTLQRIEGLEEPFAVAASPAEAIDGRAVRRLLRRGLRDAAAELDEAGAGPPRAAALISVVAHYENELASIALRGTDPSVLAGWDCILLSADGQARPLLGPSPPLEWPNPTAT